MGWLSDLRFPSLTVSCCGLFILEESPRRQLHFILLWELSILPVERQSMATLQELFSDLSSTQKQTLCGIFSIIVLLGLRIYNKITYPANLPRIRERPGSTRFGLRTTLAYYFDCKNLWLEAYNNVCSLQYATLTWTNTPQSTPRRVVQSWSLVSASETKSSFPLQDWNG